MKEMEAAVGLTALGAEVEVATTPPIVLKAPRPRARQQKYSYAIKQDCINQYRKEGKSISAIARDMRIPKSNVNGWVKDRALGKHGKEGLLSTQEEEWLKDHIKHMARRGHGFDYLTMRYEVGYILECANDERFGQLDQGLPSKLLHLF